MKKLILLTTVILFVAMAFAQNTYTLDNYHSRLSFKVKHLGISQIEGNFKTFSAKVVTSKDDYSDMKVEMTADVKSINTEMDMRDNDLRGAGWFDVEKFPTLTFKSTEFKKVSDNQFKLAGNFTMHGITKPIVFDVEYNGKILNQHSKKYIVGFTITGKLNRNDFGVGSPNAVTVGDEIKMESNVEFVMN
jgi:polyisoprenoid-binding protein YceI